VGFAGDAVAAAEVLRTAHGHDAVHVAEAGLRAADDAQVAAAPREDGRPAVTENVADFAAERDVVLVFILKRNPPAGGGRSASPPRIFRRFYFLDSMRALYSGPGRRHTACSRY
jgi:hypothetical protein